MQFAWGYAPPLILEAALNWRVFDLLAQGAQTVGELAAESGASVRGLSAILNALVGLEFLARKGTRYALTAESAAFLVSTKPAYHGGFFQHISRQLMPNWLQLTEAVRTGQPVVAANQKGEGQEFFAEFVEGLFPLSYKAAQVLGEHLGIPKAASPVSVLDIGAGSGVWGIALARQSPQVRIQAVDWPAVLEVTRKVARRHGVGDRLRTVAGDLLEADLGAGHQVATIGHILHSEGRERSRQLLRKTFTALAPGGTIVISEFLPNDERTGPPMPLIFAVNMLLHTAAGDTFTFAEIAGWLREVGFVNPRLLEAPAPSPLVLATRPKTNGS
jgi:2-polyprenyl-3-methyl-5-hydroxy-6-metoxy-1,4-benzoquinol methylase